MERELTPPESSAVCRTSTAMIWLSKTDIPMRLFVSVPEALGWLASHRGGAPG